MLPGAPGFSGFSRPFSPKLSLSEKARKGDFVTLRARRGRRRNFDGLA